MRIKFLADCHIGNPKTLGGPRNAGINRRGQQVLESFHNAMQVPADLTIILGDLFDSDTPSPVIINRVQQEIQACDGPVHIVVGNHDLTSTAAGHHACSPTAPVAKVHESRGEFWANRVAHVLCAPYQPGPAKDWLPDVVEELCIDGPIKQPRILCLHLGISTPATAEYLRHAEDSISTNLLFELMRTYHIDMCFAGNWHERHSWYAQDGREIHQVGCTAPTGFNNPGADDYGWVSVLDTDRMNVSGERVQGPRFFKIDDSKPRVSDFMSIKGITEFVHENATSDDHVYLSVDTRPLRHPAWLKIIEDLKHANVICDGRVRTDKSVLDDASGAAAQEAIEADNVDAAIDGYVDAMTVSPGVQRKDIKRLVKEAL